uniref:Cyclin G1 n=1 Tax=Sinocyclocheilus anshuiensis TaxID=1608454 RepID=A0A671RBU1_9TELE
MIDQVTGVGALPFALQLKALLDQEARYQPKLCGLRVVESAQENGLRMTVKLRDFQVRDLLSLTRFFGFSSETFSLAVNLLDRFLAVMKIQPKHLSCVALCCFYIAVKTSEEEKSVPLASDLLRISQNRFTVHDMMRMEKIILEKLCWKVKAPTALHFLRFFHALIQEQLDAESAVKRLIASKIKVFVYIMYVKNKRTKEEHDFFAVKAGDLVCVRELVTKCLAEYASTKCLKPNGQRLRWMISGRTARQLKHSYYKIAHLPTIPEYAC